MERVARIDRAYAVAAAAAQGLNDELTIILSTVTDSLSNMDEGEPTRALLQDLQASAQRCAWKAARLLRFTQRHGMRPTSAQLESLTDC